MHVKNEVRIKKNKKNVKNAHKKRTLKYFIQFDEVELFWKEVCEASCGVVVSEGEVVLGFESRPHGPLSHFSLQFSSGFYVIHCQIKATMNTKPL